MGHARYIPPTAAAVSSVADIIPKTTRIAESGTLNVASTYLRVCGRWCSPTHPSSNTEIRIINL